MVDMQISRRILLPLATLMLGACASAPQIAGPGLTSTSALEVVRAERHARVERFVDAESLLQARSVRLDTITVADAARVDLINDAQAALVVNRAARDICVKLARHYQIGAVDQPADLSVELLLTGIRATGRGAAGIPALLGVVVPGPFRLPAGLGGLAMEAVVRDEQGRESAVLHWAQGANAVMDSAQVSTIGDAYQLAGSFAKDFSRLLIDPQGQSGADRQRLARAAIAEGQSRCRARFGAASIAGRGASLLLPLAPEAIDAGAPAVIADPGTQR